MFKPFKEYDTSKTIRINPLHVESIQEGSKQGYCLVTLASGRQHILHCDAGAADRELTQGLRLWEPERPI